MTISIELVVLGSLGLVGLVAVSTVLLVVWCESDGKTQDDRKAPRARTTWTRRRVSELSPATSTEKALVSSMAPGSTARQ